MAHLDVNSSAVIRFTARLEQLNRSAYPVAVRQTLNDAAFDVKNRTLTKSANKNFTRRSPNFFKTFSRVDKAVGFNVNSMRSIVGMSDNGKQSAKTAINNMEKQEEGGVIEDGSIYLKDSRRGSVNKGLVRRSNYYDKSRVVTGKSRVRRGGGTNRSKFVARAFRSLNDKKPMFFNSMRGNYLMQVQSIKRSKDGKLKIKSSLLMKARKDKPARLKGTHFTKEAAMMTVKMIETFYIRNANKQFARVLR